MDLRPSQQAALDHVTHYARERAAGGRALIDHVLRMADIAAADFEDAVAAIRTHARVGLHFHPDRPGADGTTVVEGLLATGVYRSQFETQLSSGSVTAYASGARDLWEQELFGGAYQADGASAAERPKYGALDLQRHADGPSPRFGSCHLVLAPSVTERCTFTYGDSHQSPKERGTLAVLDDLLGALLAESFTRSAALGMANQRPPQLIEQLRSGLQGPTDYTQAPARNLDHYIEAQVHGDVRLANDVEALVVDPSFQGTATGDRLETIGARAGVALHWHPGFVLAADEVPSDFRGATMPSLGERIARDGSIDARRIGDAAKALHADSEAWADRGTPAEVLQELKLLWHCLLQYGKPAPPA